jgi:hypothetical protein
MGPLSLRSRRGRRFSGFLSILTAGIAAAATGCGGGSGTGPKPVADTAVVVLASSTANDQLFWFNMTLQSLTLTSESGNTVSLIASPVDEEFMHLNGRVEPVATASIPDGVYTSATLTVSGAFPACAGEQSFGGLLMDEGLGAGKGTAAVTITPAQSITVSGSAMGLVLDLDVSKSAPFSGGCSQSLSGNVSVTPTFDLSPLSIAAEPSNSANGMVLGVQGLVNSVAAGSFTAGALMTTSQTSTIPAWQVSVNGTTAFQGVGGISALTAGMPVDMDLAIQPEGSLLATRVAVHDANTNNLSLAFGPPMGVYPPYNQSIYPVMSALEVEQESQLEVLTSLIGSYGLNATYAISGELANVQSLPFPATFGATNLVAGQNILFTTNAAAPVAFTPMDTITLLPQTIDGTVSAIASEGNFTTYTVTLAPYDLFPNLATQGGQTTQLTSPDTVTVYADSNTAMLNQSPLAAGDVFRFYGLVFNDNGTLRMDCAQVNDGVAE